MRGNEDGTFYAEGKVTVAEAITIAARLHNIYYGYSGQFLQASPWYQIYVDYAVERGMIETDMFDDYERPITRKEMASLLSKAVELTELERINERAAIPDVPADDEDYAAIQALYESGVLTGSEADGDRVILNAKLPVRTSLDYAVTLAAATGGRGAMSVKLHGWRECPPGLEAAEKRRGVDPLDTSKYILAARSALEGGIFDL
jgi:hypothetical protein